MPIIKWDETYRAFGTIDRHGRAYVAIRSNKRPEIEGAIRLPPNQTLEHAIQRAREINEAGELKVTTQQWVDEADLPGLFSDPQEDGAS